ncbi:MAG: DUF4019 domain-containing protein [Desulfobulbus sp.]
MKILSAVVVSLLLTCLAPLAYSAASKPTEARVEEVQSWLGLIDAGNYGKSWQTASNFLQSAVSEANWTSVLQASRTPLGTLVHRNHQTSQQATSLPGAPDGEYCILTFSTEFAKKKTATETVTIMRESDGQWRAAGYFIK